MAKTLHYIFDPLCGWCYGASGALAAITNVPGVELRLLPSGLFSGAGARPMDDALAAHAWSNDQRIQRLTGQRFTERYRSQVLADRAQLFDSGQATVALAAVALTDRSRELGALKAIQQARYVDGLDITRLDALEPLLRALDLRQAAELLLQSDAALLAATSARADEAKALLRQFDARGVPTFVLEKDGQRQLWHTNTLFSNPQAFVEQLAAA